MPDKSDLITLDYSFGGEPFSNVAAFVIPTTLIEYNEVYDYSDSNIQYDNGLQGAAEEFDTSGLDFSFIGEPFYGVKEVPVVASGFIPRVIFV